MDLSLTTKSRLLCSPDISGLSGLSDLPKLSDLSNIPGLPGLPDPSDVSGTTPTLDLSGLPGFSGLIAPISVSSPKPPPEKKQKKIHMHDYSQVNNRVIFNPLRIDVIGRVLKLLQRMVPARANHTLFPGLDFMIVGFYFDTSIKMMVVALDSLELYCHSDIVEDIKHFQEVRLHDPSTHSFHGWCVYSSKLKSWFSIDQVVPKAVVSARMNKTVEYWIQDAFTTKAFEESNEEVPLLTLQSVPYLNSNRMTKGVSYPECQSYDCSCKNIRSEYKRHQLRGVYPTNQSMPMRYLIKQLRGSYPSEIQALFASCIQRLQHLLTRRNNPALYAPEACYKCGGRSHPLKYFWIPCCSSGEPVVCAGCSVAELGPECPRHKQKACSGIGTSIRSFVQSYQLI